MIMNKDIFVGILLSTLPHLNISKHHQSKISRQIHHYWLIPVKNRKEIYEEFAEEHCLNFKIATVNNTEYIRIQERTTLLMVLRMIPPALLESCPRLLNFYKIMKMIRKKEHLTEDGFNHILRLRDKMMIKGNSKNAKEYEV